MNLWDKCGGVHDEGKASKWRDGSRLVKQGV